MEWTRTADCLSTDGRDHWGRHLRRARLDRFDLTGVHHGFMFDYTWEHLTLLVLNPDLLLSFELFINPNNQSSPRVRESAYKHILGSARPEQLVHDEMKIAKAIIRQMGRKNNLRVLSINKFWFWIEPSNKRTWYLSDALEDKVQSLHIQQYLTQADWEFLSEQVTPISDRGASTATFFKYQRLGDASSETSPALDHLLDDLLEDL